MEPDTKHKPWLRLAALGVAAAALLAVLVVVVVVAAPTDDPREDAGPPSSGPTSTSAARDEQAGSTEPAVTDLRGTTTSGAAPSGGAISDGVSTVGEDVPPGRYIATGIDGDACEWARLGGPAGDTVIAGETGVAHQAIVDILGTDAAFRSSGCGTWGIYAPPEPPPLTTIDQGDWVVGEQVAPGAYLVPRSPTCTWTRATGFEHLPREIAQTERTNLALEGPYLVTLSAGERFTTKGCDLWTAAG